MKKREKPAERFAVAYEQQRLTKSFEILVDRETGVNYLFYLNGYGGGLKPLLDENGRPVVTLPEDK